MPMCDPSAQRVRLGTWTAFEEKRLVDALIPVDFPDELSFARSFCEWLYRSVAFSVARVQDSVAC